MILSTKTCQIKRNRRNPTKNLPNPSSICCCDPLIPVVIVATARVLLALATDGVVLGVGLVFFVGS
jgi:hypothetical protein